MNATLVANREDDDSSQQSPEPIRVIRHGQWVTLASEAEMSADERRAAYVAAFNIYGGLVA